MAIFRVGQKVCFKETQRDNDGLIYYPSDIFTISKIYHNNGDDFCRKRGSFDNIVELEEHRVDVCTCHLRPISYSTDANFEVIANFAPHEGIETDVPVKKKEEAGV